MIVFFCFKQKTAYELRISDWSSDVCSSDLSLAAKNRRSESQCFPRPVLRHPSVSQWRPQGGRRLQIQRRRRNRKERRGATALSSPSNYELRKRADRPSWHPPRVMRVSLGCRVSRIISEIERASCRERGGQYVKISGGGGILK